MRDQLVVEHWSNIYSGINNTKALLPLHFLACMADSHALCDV